MSLNTEAIKSIEDKTKDILAEAYGDTNLTPPIDLNRILKQFGITIKKGDFKDPSISGAYNRKEKTIFISESESPQRQLFTIAHEIGHYVLHDDKNEEVFYRVQILQLGQKKPNEEKEADWFAASLLMPASLMKTVWVVIKDIDQIATFFGVSRSAARWRLKNLGLVE